MMFVQGTYHKLCATASNRRSGVAPSVLAEYHVVCLSCPMCSRAGGALTGKYLGPSGAPPGSRFDLFGQRYGRFNSPRVQAAVAKYVDIAKAAGLTPAQLGYAFCRCVAVCAV